MKKIASNNTLGTAYLLDEMVGLAEMSDERDDLEMGSDSLYHMRRNSGHETQLRPQSTNMTSWDFKQKEEFQKLKHNTEQLCDLKET